jgi:hypothetical protein
VKTSVAEDAQRRGADCFLRDQSSACDLEAVASEENPILVLALAPTPTALWLFLEF